MRTLDGGKVELILIQPENILRAPAARRRLMHKRQCPVDGCMMKPKACPITLSFNCPSC